MADRRGGWLIRYKSVGDKTSHFETIRVAGGISEEQALRSNFRVMHPEWQILSMEHPESPQLPSDVYVG